MEDIRIFTVDNFDKEAVQSSLPVFIEFVSEKYPSCRRLSAIVDLLSEKYKGRVRFGRIDTDAQPKLASLMNIGGLPCILLLQKGRVYANIGGILPQAYYEKLVDRMLSESGKGKLTKGKLCLFSKRGSSGRT